MNLWVECCGRFRAKVLTSYQLVCTQHVHHGVVAWCCAGTSAHCVHSMMIKSYIKLTT